MEQKERSRNSKKKSKKKVNIYYLPIEEVNKIIAAAKNLRDSIVLKILARTGMRRFELCNLRIQDIDFERRKIYIPKAKGNIPRPVPADPDTLQSIKFYIGSRQYGRLIQSNKKDIDGIDESRINAIVKNTAERAKIKHPDPIRKHVNPHIFRHSYVRHLIKQGVPPTYIQQILGHSDIKITLQMYGTPSFNDVQEKYDEIVESFYTTV